MPALLQTLSTWALPDVEQFYLVTSVSRLERKPHCTFWRFNNQLNPPVQWTPSWVMVESPFVSPASSVEGCCWGVRIEGRTSKYSFQLLTMLPTSNNGEALLALSQATNGLPEFLLRLTDSPPLWPHWFSHSFCLHNTVHMACHYSSLWKFCNPAKLDRILRQLDNISYFVHQCVRGAKDFFFLT